jgi:hypothetical protein
VPLYGSDTALTTVEIPGHGPVALPPICLPYSPEFEPAATAAAQGATASPALPLEASRLGWGLAALERLARSTGGKERIDLASAWKDIPKHPRLIPLSAWLLIGAAIVLLLEVLERLTGLLSRGGRILRRSPGTRAPALRSAAAPAVEIAAPQQPASPTTAPAAPAAAKPAPAEVSGILEALRQVQKRRESKK